MIENVRRIFSKFSEQGVFEEIKRIKIELSVQKTNDQTIQTTFDKFSVSFYFLIGVSCMIYLCIVFFKKVVSLLKQNKALC